MVRHLFLALFLIALVLPSHQAKADSLSPGVFQGENYFVFSPDGKYLVKVFHTENTTWVRIHETGEMRMLTQWKIPGFKAHTIRFSLKDPSKLLLADKNQLLVYRLVEEKQKLLFLQPRIKGREIVQAYFNSENDEIVWATKSNVYKTDPEKKKQKKILSVPWETGKINSVTILSSQDYAVNLENSKEILLLSSGNGFDPVELNRHKSTVVGIQSPGRDRLMSLDTNYELITWNTVTQQSIRQLKLEKPDEDAKLMGFTLDDPKRNLLVLSKVKNEYIGQKYSLKDLEQGRSKPENLPMTMTSVGNVYSSISSFKPFVEKELAGAEQLSSRRETVTSWESITQEMRRNTLFDLAAIEADNGDYEAALELIRKIPLDDPEYGESRKLKREVLTSIEIRDSIDAARDQYKRGNYKSARIVLENTLIKNPGNREVTLFLEKVDSKTSNKTWLKIALILILLLLIVLLAFVLWRYQYLAGGKKPVGGKKVGITGLSRKKGKKEESINDLRRKFIYKLDETRRNLSQAAAGDTGRRYKNTWMEMTARLNTMEKRAKLSDNHLAEFLSELEKLQVTINKLNSLQGKKTGFSFDEEPTENRQEKKQKETGKTRKDPPQNENTEKIKDYHEILGVKKNATLDEIKKAYRNKMKEYHPDKHNASSFEWVKDEADKRTKLIQEAYVRLSSSFQ